MTADSPKRGWFPTISLMSGLSLMLFGGTSALISALFWSPSGLLVGLALFIHGWLEMRWRRAVVARGKRCGVRLMAANQVALAVSLSVYFLFQAETFSSESAMRALRHELVQEALTLYPPEVAAQLESTLPTYLQAAYGLVFATVWIGCLGMACYYWLKQEPNPTPSWSS